MEPKIFTDQEYAQFEQIWIKENVNNIYGVAKKTLSDDDYINYHIWEDIHFDEMYKKHLPNSRVCRGNNPNIIFHGGCLGCKSQRIHGINRCKGCQYFKFNPLIPQQNLFISGEESAKISGKELNNFLNDTDDEED